MVFKLDTSENRLLLFAFIIYLAIALVMFWQVTINFGSRVVNGGGDVYQSMWGLWWVPYAIFVLHQSPYITSYLFSPVGANLASQTMSPLAGILTAPLQALVGLAATYNILFFLSFALGGLFMFMLARYLVKNDYAAFIAGLVFAFSPVHIAQAYSHLQWTTIEFIPLFVLCLLLMLRTKKWKYALFAAISFVLLTFAGDIEQGIMAVTFLIVALLALIVLERQEVLNKSTILNTGFLVVFIVILASPFLIWILPNLSAGISGASQLSDVVHNMLYSDNLASFFLPSYYNGIFHSLALGYVNSVYALTYQGIAYTPAVTEKISYLGYSVIFLALLALYHEHRKNKMRDIIFWIVIFVVFALLAVGPYLQIGSTSTGIPTLYALYRNIPLFNLVREPGRFDVIVTLALAVLAAVGFDHLSKSKWNTMGTFALAIIFTALIIIEYNGTPLSGSFASQLTTNAQIPAGYHDIRQLQGNYTVLVLPALPNITTDSYFYPGVSMYYQTAFEKPIVGGYATRTNTSEEQTVDSVPLAVSASYLQAGQGLVFPYAIRENYTQLNLFWLTVENVGVVAVINKAYNATELADLQNYLYGLFGNPTYVDANVTVFKTSATENAYGLKNMVAYTVGTWISGYDFCSQYQCNQTLANAWWGSNVRAVTIFSPNATIAKMKFRALSYEPTGQLNLYYGSGTTPLSALNLTSTFSNYSVSLPLAQGLNQLVFYQQNTTISQQYPYFNYGVENITIT